jgi:hypothetical protein
VLLVDVIEHTVCRLVGAGRCDLHVIELLEGLDMTRCGCCVVFTKLRNYCIPNRIINLPLLLEETCHIVLGFHAHSSQKSSLGLQKLVLQRLDPFLAFHHTKRSFGRCEILVA